MEAGKQFKTRLTPVSDSKGKVTTVIPTFNREELICEAIDSVLAQDYQPHEIFVIDDGSTDQTAHRLREYGDRIRYIYQENRGQSAAKNRGILESNAEFIATLDSDDRWLPGKLTKQVKLASQDDQIGLVYTDKLKFSGQQIIQQSDQSAYTFQRGWVLDDLLQENFVVSTSVLGRRSAFLKAGLFNESLRVAEDYDLWLRMARICKFDFVDEVLVEYRLGNPSIGSSIGSYFPFAIRILDDFLKTYYNGGYPNLKVVRRAYANRFRALGNAHLAANEHGRAYRAYLGALRYEPLAARNYRSLARALVPNCLADKCRSWKRKARIRLPIASSKKAKSP